MTTISPILLPRRAPRLRTTSPLSAAWLLSWSLARAGYPAKVALGPDPFTYALDPQTTPPKFALHLPRAMPLPSLTRALAQLNARRSPRALLLTRRAPSHPPTPYREHLRLDDALDVLSIHRTFHQHQESHRHHLVAVAWRLPATPWTIAGHPWRTARHLLRHHDPRRLSTPDAPLPADDADARHELLAHLTPHALKDLARDLGYAQIATFVFAHPAALIHPDAILRAPLFIDADTVIGPDHIHVGPAWLSPGTTPTTFPASTLSPNGRRPVLPTPLQTAPHHPYFVAPVAPPRTHYVRFKRLFDIFFSLFVLLITLPLSLGAAIAIKFYDRGPVFFAHKREGLNGKPFGCLKFRTMVRNAEALKQQLKTANQVDGPQFKIAHDPRITPIGRFLRKTNIDELPQFLNVLAGQMSVVGPRPSPFDENQLCPGWREARLSVRPGITGLWQVSRSRERGAADFQEWIYFDTQYVERRSFSLDLRIILLTLKEMFGKGQ